MNQDEVIAMLEKYKLRLKNDVLAAYNDRGSEFGRERFLSWRNQITKFLNENLPGAAAKLDRKLNKIALYRAFGETDIDVFVREDFTPAEGFIDSLILDIRNNEHELLSSKAEMKHVEKNKKTNTRVFIVHGHDELLKTKVARFVEKLGLQAVILHEQANKSMTIIEKIEAYTDVGFAIVLYTSDDKGNVSDKADKGELNGRARQNVIFEHGFLIAKLSRERVVPLVSSNIELPSDISGMVYIEDSKWEMNVAREMKAVGYEINLNQLI